MDFSEIRLTSDQKSLLAWIVEQTESGRRNMLAAVNPEHDFIEANGTQRLLILYTDLEELREKGMVRYAERPIMGTNTRPVAERVAVTAEGREYLDWLREASSRLSVRLTDEQIDLLLLLVELTRRDSGGNQYEFHAWRAAGGDFIMGPGQNPQVFFPDILELAKKNLITYRATNSGGAFVVSPEGFSFYEEVKRSRGEAVERVEAETRHLLDRHIVDQFAEAGQLWREAEDILWQKDAPDQVTSIGHKCREALQSFAQAMYTEHCSQADPLPKEQTHNKIRSVLVSKRSQIGEKTELALNAYWQAIDGLAQRAEHGSQRDSRPLLWEDGRRLVFQTLLVMVEIAAAVT